MKKFYEERIISLKNRIEVFGQNEDWQLQIEVYEEQLAKLEAEDTTVEENEEVEENEVKVMVNDSNKINKMKSFYEERIISLTNRIQVFGENEDWQLQLQVYQEQLTKLEQEEQGKYDK